MSIQTIIDHCILQCIQTKVIAFKIISKNSKFEKKISLLTLIYLDPIRRVVDFYTFSFYLNIKCEQIVKYVFINHYNEPKYTIKR